MFKTAIFLSVIFTVILKGKSLDCYVCYDCDQVTDDYVASCEDLDSNSTSSTTTTTTTTTSTTPTSTSTDSSTNSTNSTTSTTTLTTTAGSTESTTATSTATNTTTTTTTEGSFLMDRDASTNNTYECFQGKITVNSTQITVRSCIANRGNASCESFGLTSCSVCSTDKCNGAGSIQFSVAVLLMVSVSTYLFKK